MDWSSKAPGGAAWSLASRSNQLSASAFPRQTANLSIWIRRCSPLLAEQYGLEAGDFEREFVAGGERFRSGGIDPRRLKYPISVERIPDRRGFKFTAENVAMLLKAQAKP